MTTIYTGAIFRIGGWLLYMERNDCMKYEELKKLFAEHEGSHPEYHLTAYITFSSFGPENHNDYDWESRTYSISSDNKAFQPNMGGYSIFGSCLDGIDCCLRLERLMAEEHGGKDGWVVDECCVVGYLLLEGGDYGVGSPKIFYAMELAQQEMLSRMARFVYADFAALEKRYRKNGCEVDGDCCHAGRYNAYASTIKDSGSWRIKPVYIKGLLDITIGDEQ